ncbi:Serine/threonine-protein kinase WNK8 [Bienertia sinuspersici]
MRCFHSWVDNESKTVNMITELFTSGNMSQYRKKHNLVNKKAIRNWVKQILKGLDYPHSQNPPIIHKHLRCDNIFVNGNSGKVKIGDIGLATMLHLGSTARATSSMPEFMALELCEEDMISYTAKDQMMTGYCSPNAAVEEVKSKNQFKLQGKMTQNKESVSMSLWIGECGNKTRKVQFEFILQTDTVQSVMEETAKELELSANDAALIAKLMEELITHIVPGYKSVAVSSSSELHIVDQQIKLLESPCVRNQDEAEQDSADRSLLNDLKTNDSSESAANHTKVSSFSVSYNDTLGSFKSCYNWQMVRISCKEKAERA